ncbi:hypothetical protein AB0M54_19875 [Actinoplanes sp. NPDC051470]|uniref:hypothetical protein n=1 Tax=Actinoplanes sp. NPDC051470 TaxID=3157224 RepID=UPI0034236D96
MTSVDDELLADLRRLAALVDPVPQHVREAARAAFLTRDLDAELAELIADSTADADFEPVRQATDERLLSFAADGTQVEMTVRAEGAGWTMMGQVFGAGPGTEAVVESDGRATTPLDLDDLGRFLVGDLASGPVRLRCDLPGGAKLVTSWVIL